MNRRIARKIVRAELAGDGDRYSRDQRRRAVSVAKPGPYVCCRLAFVELARAAEAAAASLRVTFEVLVTGRAVAEAS